MQLFARFAGVNHEAGAIPAAARLELTSEGLLHYREGPWRVDGWGDLRFRGRAPASPETIGAALIAGFARDPLATVQELQGHFGLIVRRERDGGNDGELWAAIDRTGVQRLYYASQGGALLLASHLQRLRQALDPALNPQAIFNYLYFHMIPSPDTIYRDCFKLEPGQLLHWRNGRIDRQNYFQPRFRQADEPTPGSAKRRLLPTLEQAVRERSGEGVGAFLSGGLDSSTVAGLLAKVSAHPPATFNIAFDEERYDESPWARLSAQHFHTRHHEYRLQPDEALAVLPRIAQFYEEPFGNSSALPTYFCARIAKEQGITRLLAGDGGDELFAGNTRYAKQKLFEPYRRLPGPLRRGSEALLAVEGEGRLPGPLGKLQSYIRQANVPLPDRLQSYNFLHLHAPETVFARDLLDACDPQYPLRLWRQRYAGAGTTDAVDAMLYLDWKFTLADNDLVKVNNMCALAGIEVGYPMLDDAMLQLAQDIAPEDKLPGQNLRAFYKSAVKGFLPDATLNKSKHGFGLPFGLWLQTHAGLRELVHETLRSLRQRELLRPDFIDDARAMHEQGHAGYYGELVWLMLMLELWLQGHA
jgi:asparagine synthase (glutamine-hydrolysing)